MRRARFELPGREGFALVTSLLIILLLSLIAVAAVVIATTEKRTSFAESIHASAVFSADAGAESAIHFLRFSDGPPRIVDFASHTVRNQANTILAGDQAFGFRCQMDGPPTGPESWGTNYRSFNYRIASTGRAAAGGRSDVDLLASRIFREGY